jgi:hypothetical protein
MMVSLFIVFGSTPASATKCDCKPEINAEAEGIGTCEKTQDDSKWCKLKFNSATGRDTPEQKELFETLKKYMGSAAPLDNVKAADAVNQVPPDKWDKTFIADYLASLFAVALYDTAPERIPGIVKILQAYPDKLLRFVQDDEVRRDQFEVGGFRRTEKYSVTGSRGCLQFVEQSFSALVKTRHSFATKGCAEVKR